MGILVICSYRPKAGQDAQARRLMDDHVPLLRRHGLVTERAVVRGIGKTGDLIEIFEWASEEKSRSAPHDSRGRRALESHGGGAGFCAPGLAAGSATRIRAFHANRVISLSL